MKKHFSISVLLPLFVFIFISTNKSYSQEDKDFEILKNIEIYTSLLRTLNTNYVDQINPSELMNIGIEAMLNDLDPYTVFVNESEIEDFRFLTTGEYGGIGSLIHMRNDKVYISEPYENSPAQIAGLKAGDIILSINNQSAKGKNVQDVSSMLRGQPNTSINIEIERQGVNNPINFEVVRKKISIPPVPYYGLLENDIAYIKLNSFTQDSYAEVKKAFVELRQKKSLNGLILDLRDNSGGLLTEAVNIVNLFVKKGEYIVSTKGKQEDKNAKFNTNFDPIDTNIPLVVLVNGRSASASEIVSGAIQDLDRGIIIGRRTFGKGLVQNIFPLKYNTQVKVTVAKYYIPSGRCIQAIDYTHTDGSKNPEIIPDSLLTEFKTKNGRIVYDGKGINPDLMSDTVSFSSIVFNLITQYIIFDYATNFVSQNPEIAPAEDFKLTDKQYNDFVNYVQSKDIKYKTQLEYAVEDLKKAAEFENYFDDIKTEFDQLNKIIENHKKQDIITNKEIISQLLEQEIISRYYFQKGRIINELKTDKDVKKANDILIDKNKYSSILSK